MTCAIQKTRETQYDDGGSAITLDLVGGEEISSPRARAIREILDIVQRLAFPFPPPFLSAHPVFRRLRALPRRAPRRVSTQKDERERRRRRLAKRPGRTPLPPPLGPE